MKRTGTRNVCFFTWPYTVVGSYYLRVYCLSENKGKRNLDYFPFYEITENKSHIFTMSGF